nr:MULTISPECIES: 2-phospho-L-lactate guanylyltransferase [unclassified Ornithinimicrobium]
MVVPVKEASIAKSRLQPPPPLSRPALARALAQDTLEAVCRGLPPADVVTVTSDDHIAAIAASLGCTVVDDPGAGLNAAVREGLQVASVPGAAVAVLLGDLPALRAEDLLAGLAACGQHERAVVPDLLGTGTVLLTGGPGVTLTPRFGTGSAARHAERAVTLALDLPRLRQDVDDLADLTAAAQLGVGPHTARVLAEAAAHADVAPAN